MRNFSVHPLRRTIPGHEMDTYASAFAHWKDMTCYLTGSEQSIRSFLDDMGKCRKEINPQYYIGQKDFLGDKLTLLSRDAEQISSDILAGKARILCVDMEYDQYKKDEAYWTQHGAALNQQFFQSEVFLPVWETYLDNYLRLDRVEIFLTSKCTLKCEKCLHFIPHLFSATDTDLDQLKRDADILFSRVDYIKKLKLLGGEVFLYPYLKEYLIYLCNNYANQIGEIRLGTNGTILPSKDLLEVCKNCQTIIDISDYSVAVPKRCKTWEAKKYFESHGLKVDVKRSGEKWLDLGFPTIKPPIRTKEENQVHFQACAMFCRQFAHGKLYFCCSNYAAVRAGLFVDDSNNYFDFHRSFSKKELLEFELGFTDQGYLTFCEVCQGGSEVANSHQVEVATQMYSATNR